MRVKNSLKNAAAGMSLQGTMILLGFISRKIFIIFLGEEYLGLNGLFSNVLSLLSMAELGVSTSIIYSLYTPLANDNKSMITKLMNFYKTSYKIIAGVIFVLGMILLPFIHKVVGQTTFSDNFIKTTYVLFLLMTVSTYFFSYKRSIVYADQKNYKIMYFDLLFKFISFMVSTITLFLFKNYIIYIVCLMVIGVSNNYIVAKYVDKLYPFLKANNLKLEQNEVKKIITNTKNIFIHKVAGTVISSTDNVIISVFLGIVQVGTYSNYSLLVMSVQGITSKLLDSCQAGIGNLLVVETKEKIEETLKNMTFAAFLLTSFCTVSLFCLTNDFITLWLGERYLLGIPIVAICAINFFTLNIKNPLYQFVNVSGLFKDDRNNAIIGVILNISLSLVFVKQYGIFGIFLGAYLASLVTLVLKSKFFYKKYLHKSSAGFLLSMALFFIIVLLEMVLCYYLCSLATLSSLVSVFLIKGVICLLCPNAINIIIFYNTKEFKYLAGLVTAAGVRWRKTDGIRLLENG